MKVWLACSYALCLAWLLTSQAAAQPACDGASYRESIRRALQEYELGNFDEARLLFKDAHAQCPSARTFRGLGFTAYAMRDYVAASDLLEQALASEVRPLTDRLRSAAAETLEQARHYEARLEVIVTPPDAELRVDEDVPPRDGSDASVRVNPGVHALSISLAGFRSERRQLSVEAGGRKRVRVELQRIPARGPEQVALAPRAAAPAPQLIARTPDAPPSSGLGVQRSAALVAGAVGLVAVGVGSVFGLRAVSKHDEASKYCDGSSCSDPRGRDAGNDARLAGNISTVAMILGAVGLASGITLWLVEPHAERPVQVTLGPDMLRIAGRL
jgi:hypothetical protein